jgi:hypothetical protein
MMHLVIAFLFALLSPLLGTVPRGQEALFILSGGEEIFGQLVLERSAYLYLKVEDRICQIKAEEVARTIPKDEIPAEYRRRRRRLEGTARAHYALGQWCRKVGLVQEATSLISRALSLDPRHTEARKALEELRAKDITRVPWKEDEPVCLKVEVMRSVGTRLRNDELLWSRLKSYLVGARPLFAVLPFGDNEAKPHYILRVETEADVVKENRFYGEVLLSRTLRGEARLFVLHPKTREKLFVLKPVALKETYGVSERRAADRIQSRAFEKLMVAIREHPGFRLKKKPAARRRKTRKRREREP